MIVAPVLGFTVDLVGKHGWGGQFWPIGAAGAAIALVFLVATRLSAGRETGEPAP